VELTRIATAQGKQGTMSASEGERDQKKKKKCQRVGGKFRESGPMLNVLRFPILNVHRDGPNRRSRKVVPKTVVSRSTFVPTLKASGGI